MTRRVLCLKLDFLFLRGVVDPRRSSSIYLALVLPSPRSLLQLLLPLAWFQI